MSSTEYTEKFRANIRQPSVVKDEQTKSATHAQRTAKTEEAAFTENVLRSSTENDGKVKTSTNTQRKLTVKHEEAKGKPIIHRNFTAKEEEHKHTAQICRPSTAKAKESKTTTKVRASVTAHDKVNRNKANSRPHLTTQEERVKISPTPRRPLTAKDKETEYTANDRPSLTAKKEKVKSMSQIPGQVTSKDKDCENTTRICEPAANKKNENKEHIRGPVASKVKKSLSNIHDPTISIDKESKITENIRRPLTVKDEKSKMSTNVIEPLKAKYQEARNKANIRLPSTAENVKANAATDMRQSLTVKGKEVKATSSNRASLTTKDKGSKKIRNISGPVASHESTVNIRGSRNFKDKEYKTETHIRRHVVSEDKESKTTTHIRRPVTSEDKESKTTTHIRRPVISEDKESKTKIHIRRPVTSKDKESKTKSHIRRPVTSDDKEYKTTTHIRRPVTSEDKESKTKTHIHRPVTSEDKESKTKIHIRRPVTSEDKESKTTIYIRRPVTSEDKEYKTTIPIRRPEPSEDKDKTKLSSSMALFDESKDEETLETPKDVSKTDPGDHQYAESSVKIPTQGGSIKGEKLNVDDNKTHVKPFSENNKGDRDIPRKGKDTESTTYSRRHLTANETSDGTKIHMVISANASSEQKIVQIDESIREQNVFLEYTSGAGRLNKQSRRHEQDEKYLIHSKTQNGNEGSCNAEAVQPTKHSDQRGEATHIENREIHTIKSTADIQSNSIIHNSMEINGCRPKQRSNVQKEYAKSQAFTRKRQEDVHFVFKVTEISFLKNMMDEDSGVIVSELTRSPSLLKNCIEKTATDETIMALFLQVLAKAYSPTSALQSMIPLFETLKVNGYFDILVEYLTRIIIQIKGRQRDGYTYELVLKQILSITIAQITRNPSSVVVFRIVHALMGQVIDDLVENGTIDDHIITEYQRLTEHKKAIEKEGRQATDPKQYSKPPDDFREYSISPTADEITGKVKPFLRPNTIDGGYEDLDDYLDVQFRLLREDFVGPLREGMTGYINIMTSHKGYQNANEKLKDLDIKVYENVRVHAPVVTQQGLCYKLKLQMTANLRRTQWKFSKRLIYGSMVCLTDKDFKNFFLATVVEREERDIKHGFFTVHFEREDVSTKDLLNNVFRMAETTGYFEAYRHVLSSLQTFRNGDLPFEKYIVNCEKKVGLPAYLASYLTYDLRPLVDQNVELKASRRLGGNALTNIRPITDFSQRSSIARSVHVTDHKSWPSRELLQMDDSQYRAVQTALTNELAIIQGPPGTGKTYIGLQIVKALLHNKPVWAGTGRYNRPMLIVCYTNHALDQFLEGIVKYFKGDVLRVGGRSSSAELEQFNLKTYRQRRFAKGTTLARLQFNKRSARRNMERQSRCVQKLAKTIQVYQTEILTEDVLSMEMGETLHESLEKGYRGKVNKENFSYIVKWLGIEYLKRECLKEIQNPQKAKKTKHVRVEDEIARIQKERKIDIEETLHFSAKEMSLLREIRKTDVAFFVEDIKLPRRKKGKNSDIGTLQDRMFLKLFKSIIVGKITDEDIMSQEEADNIKDIWRLNHKTKWRLYRLWIQNLCANLYEEMEANRRDFEAASERYRDALADVDKEIMRQAAVIGMTTSGAARYQSVLRDIGPRIIVVEEAAEVLEAHIITTLSKGCEHLILIGDHKQLRPNPTVYKLAVKYNLDVSFFERMVKNDMPFNCLELQHRMRPEISSIMRHIYPDLKDHEHVNTYPNVKGISTNLFLINHTHLESCNTDIRSYINTKEAEYTVALCRYLLLQGYERQDITVLTTYTGQLMYMRNLMPEEEFDGVKVTVVDNYQGEENEIVLLSLVRSNMIDKIGFLKIENRICVALSRAKIGFFVIGNFDHLANHSALWKNITTEAKAKNCYGNGLVLYCQNHPSDNAIVAKDSEDFKRAPEGGCMKKCDVRLECGHKCERHCHVIDKEHATNKCQKPCTKILCEVGHKCPEKCFIECNLCSVLMRKMIPKCRHVQLVACSTEPEDFCCQEPCEEKLECGHPCKNVCGEAHTSRCLENIAFTWPCGHTSTILCWEAKSKRCPHPCGSELQCSHICSGTCGTCFIGRIHQPCRYKCSVQHLCGHKVLAGCQDNRVCAKPCENRCSHGKCTKRCGEPCTPCKKRCHWTCPHKTCTKRCDEPCDRHWCNVPCQNLLKCQHKCIGLCGEPCPSICRLCHKKVFKEKTHCNKHKQGARYILLEACGHLVEYRFMDAYMMKHETDSNACLKCCPKCKTPIRYCLRYGNIIKVSLKDIERAKRGIIGNISIFDTLQQSVIRLTAGNLNDLKIYSYMAAGLLSPEEARTKYPSHWRRSICKQKLRERLTHLKANGLYTERQLVTVQKQYETANEIIDLTKRIMDCEEDLKHSETENSLVLFLHEMLQIVLQPRDNLTKQEDGDFRQEIKRGEAFVKFLKIKKSLQSATGAEEAAYTDLQNIESVLLDVTKFTQEKESEINGSFERLAKLLRTECLQNIDIGHGNSKQI